MNITCLQVQGKEYERYLCNCERCIEKDIFLDAQDDAQAEKYDTNLELNDDNSKESLF